MSYDPALLDTDILNEIFKARHSQVIAHAANYLSQHQQFAISAFTYYEVVRGLRFKHATTKLAEFEQLLQMVLIYPIDGGVLERAADLWVAGRASGMPHSDADLIIAATAMENGRILVTGNTHHFNWIPSLRVEDWRR